MRRLSWPTSREGSIGMSGALAVKKPLVATFPGDEEPARRGYSPFCVENVLSRRLSMSPMQYENKPCTKRSVNLQFIAYRYTQPSFPLYQLEIFKRRRVGDLKELERSTGCACRLGTVFSPLLLIVEYVSTRALTVCPGSVERCNR